MRHLSTRHCLAPHLPHFGIRPSDAYWLGCLPKDFRVSHVLPFLRPEHLQGMPTTYFMLPSGLRGKLRFADLDLTCQFAGLLLPPLDSGLT